MADKSERKNAKAACGEPCPVLSASDAVTCSLATEHDGLHLAPVSDDTLIQWGEVGHVFWQPLEGGDLLADERTKFSVT